VELRPALTPEIVGDLGAVGIGDEPADFMRAVGDRAVDLAGAVDRVRGAALDPTAMNMTRLDETDADVAGDAAHRLAAADHLRDRRFVHAILQREITPVQIRPPTVDRERIISFRSKGAVRICMRDGDFPVLKAVSQ
jgi:hypothetical protein